MSLPQSSPAAARNILEAQAKTVQRFCPGKSMSDIRMDLLFTKDVQQTINRAFDGEFLYGTSRDPRRPHGLDRVSTSSGIKVIDLSADSPAKAPLSPSTAKNRPGDAKGKDVAKYVLSCVLGESELMIARRTHPKSSLFKAPTGGDPGGDDYHQLSDTSIDLQQSHASSISKSYPELRAVSLVPKRSTAALLNESLEHSAKPALQVTRPLPPARAIHSEKLAPPSAKKRKIEISLVSDDESDMKKPEATKSADSHGIRSVASPRSDSSRRLPLTSQPGISISKDSILGAIDDYSSSDDDIVITTAEHGGFGISGRQKGEYIVTKETDSEESDASGPEPDISAKPKRRTRLTEEERTRRAAKREESRLAKKREKEARDTERALLKASKKKEKEAKELEKELERRREQANKHRNSKKDSLPEMIVDMSISLGDTAVGDQLQRFLLQLGCRVNPTWAPPAPGGWKLVKWRRRVRAVYDDDLSIFIPLEHEEIREESHLLVYLSAQEFINLALPPSANTLMTHVQHIKSAFNPKTRLIYLIEGLAGLVRKHKNLKNRAFQNRVLANLPGAASSSAARDESSIIEEDAVEWALLELQIIHECLIHHTTGPVETAEWISIFTGDISTIPYKATRTLDTSFCPETGQVKPGIGKHDTYHRTLQEITRITPSIATAIAREYPDVRRLVTGFRSCGDGALAQIENTTTRNGLPSGRTVGAACSRRVYAVFTGRDPSSLDL